MSDFPALNGETVTERHAQICRDNGHASHIVDGTDTGICPRCGEPTTRKAPAMKRTTTVTHPDGTVSQRTSKTMHYTWAVEVGPADPNLVAAQKDAQAVAWDEKAADLRAAAASPVITIRDRGLNNWSSRSQYLTHVVTLKGTDVYEWASADRQVKRGFEADAVILSAHEALVAQALRSAESYERQAADYRAKAADIRANGIEDNGFSVYRWSTRVDLAGKGAEEASKAFAGQGRTIRIRPVD